MIVIEMINEIFEISLTMTIEKDKQKITKYSRKRDVQYNHFHFRRQSHLNK